MIMVTSGSLKYEVFVLLSSKFMKAWSLTNLVSFYDQVIHPVDEGKAFDIAYLDFNTVFDSVSYSILLEKLATCGLDRYTLCRVKNWLDG